MEYTPLLERMLCMLATAAIRASASSVDLLYDHVYARVRHKSMLTNRGFSRCCTKVLVPHLAFVCWCGRCSFFRHRPPLRTCYCARLLAHSSQCSAPASVHRSLARRSSFARSRARPSIKRLVLSVSVHCQRARVCVWKRAKRARTCKSLDDPLQEQERTRVRAAPVRVPPRVICCKNARDSGCLVLARSLFSLLLQLLSNTRTFVGLITRSHLHTNNSNKQGSNSNSSNYAC